MRRNLGPLEYPIQTQQHYKRPYTIATTSPTLLPRITSSSTVYKAHRHRSTDAHTHIGCLNKVYPAQIIYASCCTPAACVPFSHRPFVPFLNTAADKSCVHLLNHPYFQWRTGWGWVGWFLGFNPPPTKFWRPSKIVPNSTRLWKLLKISEFSSPTPQHIRKKVSEVLKLPRLAIVL